MASISTRPPKGNARTATQERAGQSLAKTLAYSALTVWKSDMSVRKTVVFTTCSGVPPTVSSNAMRLSGLDSNATFGKLACGGVYAQLAGQIDHIPDTDAWEYGPTAAGAACATMHFFMRPPLVRFAIMSTSDIYDKGIAPVNVPKIPCTGCHLGINVILSRKLHDYVIRSPFS